MFRHGALNPEVSVSICWNEKGIAQMATCLGPLHGNCNFILLSPSTMFNLTNISNSSDVMVCFAMEAEVCLHWKITIVARPVKVLKHRFCLLKDRLNYLEILGI